MIRYFTAFLFLYVAALHTSMAVMEIAAYALVAGELVRIGTRYRLDRKVPGTFPMWAPLLALTLSVLVGLLLNPLLRSFWFQFGFMRWILLMYFFSWILAEVWSEEFERRFLQVWVVCLLISGVYAGFQALTGIDLVRPAAQVLSNQNGLYRPTSFFSRSLTFAYSFGVSYLTILIPTYRRLGAKWFYPTLAVGLAGIFFTLSMGAWMGLAAAALVYVALEHPKKILPAIGVIVLAVVVFMSLFNNSLTDKIYAAMHLHLNNSNLMRVHLWQAYWEMWKDHPFFGIGISQGDLMLPEYYNRLGIHEEFTSHSHNVFLQWLAGAGIFGLASYLWLSFAVLRMTWRLRASGSPWGTSLLLAQVYLQVGGLTENNFFTAIVNHMVIFGWAIGLALTQRYKNAAGTQKI